MHLLPPQWQQQKGGSQLGDQEGTRKTSHKKKWLENKRGLVHISNSKTASTTAADAATAAATATAAEHTAAAVATVRSSPVISPRLTRGR